ncbi:hypothetical protein GQ44DRAFT_727596 [Phaeosphaeriaceae sp. PMI808]|nr:hypothetical protein GQ44DRAFT_727596 [Phaeosphaeriaceae sp. PMI808]
MLGRSQGQDLRTLNEYKDLLKNVWTRSVACQNQCDPPEACSCQRRVVHVEAMKQWWLSRAPESSDQMKLLRLLDDMALPSHRTFPLEFQTYFSGQHSCLKVFSLLLSQGQGDLIDRFYDSNMNDKYLAIMRKSTDESLRDNLRQIRTPDEVEEILENFHKERGAFCPLELTLHMNRNLQDTQSIPPFCHKVKMGNKGGTASIYWVAVQKDFILDEHLKDAISASLYTDDVYGDCYQMVLKSYSGNKKTVFDSEKDNFSGLKFNDTVPIVRYLGCYTHDYGEGPKLGKTYNILLECGERDLYQAWADETNVPPVQAEEIIRFWQSLFEVAEAIRHIHHFEVPGHGKRSLHKYVGWHADIKPDNILIIHGRLKFADFGFSRFTPVAQMPDGAVPTELIHGFTDAYGAPEVSRMKLPDGTLSGVTQSIDTWSLGCVLSVAATWVVLGFQGVRQFERLRQLSPHNKIDGVKYDRFHDGFDVLPEIRKWHNYLRGHVRCSDTTTLLVLDTIENSMLQTEPNNRFELKDLCEKFKEILETATRKINSLKRHSKKTDPLVLQALLAIEETARHERTVKPKTTPPNQANAPTNVLNLSDPLQRATMQVQKERFINNKPHGRTPYRMEILEKELKANPISTERNQGPDSSHTHNGDFTASPQHTTSIADAFSIDRGLIPDFHPPHLQQPVQPPLAPQGVSRPVRDLNVRFRSRPDTQDQLSNPLKIDGLEESPPTGDEILTSHNSQAYNAKVTRTASYPYSNQVLSSPFTPTSPSKSISPQFSSPTSPAYRHLGDTTPSITHQSPISPRVSGTVQSNNPFSDIQPVPRENSILQLGSPSPSHSHFKEQRMYERKPIDHPQIGEPLYPSPNITLTHPAERTSGYMPPTNMEHEGLPISVLDLSYNVCLVRKQVDDEDPKGARAKLKGIFGREERKKNKGLTKTYDDRREIIFVVDNGASMFEHWPIVVFVAETLVKRAAGLDKSGVDLIFTIAGAEHSKTNLKGHAGRKVFREALDAAAPDFSLHNRFHTDMHMTLKDIVRNWENNGKPATTLLVLTDGIWGGSMTNLVDNVILQLAGEATTDKNVGKRPFSIQFIRFGEEGEQNLVKLDNELCSKRGFRDIVDHCSWRSTVEKMFKGSIDSQHDQHDPVETPMPYDYKKLVSLFRIFNENTYDSTQAESSSLLSPTSPPPTLSRSSSRKSKSESYHESMLPTPRTGSRRTHSRNSSSQF